MTAVLFFMLTAAASAAPILKQGSEGHDVRIVQQSLKDAGYNIRTVDGIFGNETYRALIAFQRDNDIKITGVVDRATWKKLKEIPSAPKKNEGSEAEEKSDSGTKATPAVPAKTEKPFTGTTKSSSSVPAVAQESDIKTVIENKETTIDDLIQIVKGPDFPTGGTILGTAGINEAYRTGRGKIKVRAVTDIEPMHAGKNRIVVTELPYLVNI